MGAGEDMNFDKSFDERYLKLVTTTFIQQYRAVLLANQRKSLYICDKIYGFSLPRCLRLNPKLIERAR